MGQIERIMLEKEKSDATRNLSEDWIARLCLDSNRTCGYFGGVLKSAYV